MAKELTLGRFSRDVRMQFIVLSVFFGLSYLTYYLAWGQMRYSAETLIPMEKLVYWRFALAGLLPLVGYILTAIFVFVSMTAAVMGRRGGMSVFGWFHLIFCGIALAWGLLFCAWEITAWTECNDPGPKHPECRNRKYPDETTADYSFIMMVISTGVNVFIMGMCMWLNTSITDRRLAIINISVAAQPMNLQSRMETITDNDEDTDIESGDDEQEQQTVSMPLSRHHLRGHQRRPHQQTGMFQTNGDQRGILYSSDQGN